MYAKALSLSVALAGAAVLAAPAWAATYLSNEDFSSVGAGGAGPITTNGALSPPPYSATKETGAAVWYQFTVVPGGYLTTTLLPSTDTFGGDANMLHVVTDSGDYPPAEQGNGFGQAYVGGQLLPHTTLTFDLDVLAGTVSGGLTRALGSIGVFPPDYPTWGPTDGWIQVTETMNQYLSQGVFFETLSYGREAASAPTTTSPTSMSPRSRSPPR